jgi:hypothetical protein
MVTIVVHDPERLVRAVAELAKESAAEAGVTCRASGRAA